MKKYAVIEYNEPDAVFFDGLFDSYYAALGFVITEIFWNKKNYSKEGDVFEYTEPVHPDPEEDDCYIKVTYKEAGVDEAGTFYYHILCKENCEDVNGEER